MSDQSETSILDVLHHLDHPPVLVDIGSSGAPPPIWEEIASASIYVGFDPDLRDIHDLSEGRYRRSIMLNEAVTADPTTENLRFYLTRSPHCSSTLPPDTGALEQYVFSDLFIVESEGSARATTLAKVADKLDLPNIDWIKVDSQGTDLRLFTSLPERLRSGVLALDVEPGLIDAYVGEDLFVDTHKALMDAGFWLSFVNVQGAVRIKKSTREALAGPDLGIDQAAIEQAVRRSPGWCEARYFRTIESLAKHHTTERQHILLWLFAMIDGQFAFALDVAFDFRKRFGDGSLAERLASLPIDRIRAEAQPYVPEEEPPAPLEARVSRWPRWLRGLGSVR